MLSKHPCSSGQSKTLKVVSSCTSGEMNTPLVEYPSDTKCFIRSSEPTLGLVILNRLNSRNLVLHVSPEWQVEMNESFLLYKTPDSVISGLWFYDVKELEALYRILTA